MSILEESPPFIKRTNWFLGIGINEYTEFPKLNNAVKDVQDIRRLLVDQYDFQDEHVIMLFDERANEETIIITLDHLSEDLGEEDTLLIYYSGHGHMTKKGLGYWIPQDAKRGNTARYIPNSRIRDAIGILDAKHVFLISDSCFSGSLLTKGTPRSTRLIRELDASPSRWALCSGRSDEEVDDGIPGTNSPFALSVKNVLSDCSEDSLNVARLIDRVREQVAANSNQIPEGHPIQNVGHGWGEYIFRKKGISEKKGIVLENHIKTNSTENLTHPENVAQTPGNPEMQVTKNVRTKVYKWLLIVAGVSAVIILATIFLTRDLPELTLDVQDNYVGVTASGGHPWKTRGDSYSITIERVHPSKSRGDSDSITVGIQSELYYNDLLKRDTTLRFGFDLMDGNTGTFTVTISDSLNYTATKKFDVPDTYVPKIQVLSFLAVGWISQGQPYDPDTLFDTGNDMGFYAKINTDVKGDMLFWLDNEVDGFVEVGKRPITENGVLFHGTYSRTPGRYSAKLLTQDSLILKGLHFTTTPHIEQ